MTTAILTRRLEENQMAAAALRAAAQFWFVVAVIGQWAFLYYILAFYGRTTFSGHFEAWTRNVFLRKGYVAGDTTGNVAFAAHALLAAVIAFGGAIQLIPLVRSRAIALHRWIGRVFFVTAFGLSVSGLYVLWFHGNPPDPVHGIAISLNAVLIILFIVLAWRSAVRSDIAVHRRWRCVPILLQMPSGLPELESWSGSWRAGKCLDLAEFTMDLSLCSLTLVAMQYR